MQQYEVEPVIQPTIPTLHHSPEFDKIYEALIKAQADFKPVPKNKTATVRSQKSGATYTYKYADLADVLTMALPILNVHGMALLQPHILFNCRLRVCTRIIHTSGQWLMSDGIDIPEVGPRQEFGSDSTYDRRYDLCSLLGIATDEDMDAQKDLPPAEIRQPASPRPPAQDQAQPLPRPQAQPPAQPQADSEGQKLLDQRGELIGKLKELAPGGELARRATQMFPRHKDSKTLTVTDLQRLHDTLLKERETPARAIPRAVAATDLAQMFDDGKLTTAATLTGPKIGKSLAQRLHILINTHKIHTEAELMEDYLKPLNLEHASELPRDLYEALCQWATGELREGDSIA